MAATPLPALAKIVKYIFIFFNVLFVLCGICLIGVGIWLVASNQALNFLFGSNIVGGGVLLILCGLVTFVIAGIGVAGAILQWRPLLVTFGGTLILIVVIEIIAAILGFAFQGSVDSQFRESFLKAMKDVTSDEAAKNGVFNIQSSLMCCGANGPDDWKDTEFYRQNKDMLPASCCFNGTTSGTCPRSSTGVYMTGCVSAAEALVRDNVAVAAGLGVAALLIGLVEIVGIALSFSLCICIHRAQLQVV